MPLYEYECEQDGSVIEVRRPMGEADRPLEDPEGRGRTFRRKLSVFAARGAVSSGESPLDVGCPCGKPGGGCGMR